MIASLFFVFLVLAAPSIACTQYLCVLSADAKRYLFLGLVAGVVWAATSRFLLNAKVGSPVIFAFALIAAASSLPAVNVNIGVSSNVRDGEAPFGGISSAENFLEEAISSAESASLDALLAAERRNVTLRGGYGALKFAVASDQRLRIDLQSLPSDDQVDPVLYLYVYPRGGTGHVLVASNDDSGGELNSKIEENISAGEYLLVFEDLNSPHIDELTTQMNLIISRAGIDDLDANERVTVLLDAEAQFFGVDAPRGGLTDDIFILELSNDGVDACLVVQATPSSEGDTLLVLQNSNFEELLTADDGQSFLHPLTARAVLPIGANEKEMNTIIVRSGDYEGQPYTLGVQLVAMPQEGCRNDLSLWPGEEV